MSVLLRTKLYSPQVRPDLVSRQRLLDCLCRDLWWRPQDITAADPAPPRFTRKLTLVSAPAGFGKTTLVGQWVSTIAAAARERAADGSPPHTCWLSLDDGDNEPVRFLDYLIAAIQTQMPRVGVEAQVVLQAGARHTLDEAMTLLINDVATAKGALLVVLDDYHVIRTEVVNDLLSSLIDRQPPNLHIVIVSRADPALPLSRLRVRREMLELRAHDLRFIESEIAAFLRDTMGLALTPAMIAALEQRTEGWIAGLQLAAISLQGSDDPEAFVRAFSGSNRYIIDYLVDEVLQAQPAHVRSFLVATSILDRLTAPLCDALIAGDGACTEGEGSQTVLDYLLRSNLFLIPLDDERQWYRYHHLFANSLQTGLVREQEARLHQQAARWYADNGHLPRAVDHALAAPDYELAAELLGEAGREAALWAGGDFKRYCDWVERVPETTRRAHPRLMLVFARALQIRGHLARAEAVLDDLGQLLAAVANDNDELVGMAAVYRAQCLLERGELDQAAGLAHEAMARVPKSAHLSRARTLSGLACIEYGLGDFRNATPRFLDVSRTTESPSLAANAAECAARGLLLQGKLREAVSLCDAYIAASQAGSTYNHLAAGAFATLAEVAYYRDELDCITAHGDRAVELAQRLAPEAPLRAHEIWTYLQLARLRQLQEDAEGMAAALAHADAVTQAIGNAFYLALAQSREKVFELGREHGVPALLRVRSYPPVAFSYLDEYEAWAQTQVLVAHGRHQEAASQLSRLVDRAEQEGRGLSVIELELWQSLALTAMKKTAAAGAAVARAVNLAGPEGCLRPFLEIGAPLVPHLSRLAESGTDAAKTILASWDGRAGADAMPVLEGPPATTRRPQAVPLALELEPPSEREVEILRLLSDGLSNQEIGQKLYIGVGTVKWYLTHLYSKLEVRNRTQAVARAREMGILA